MYYKKKPFYIIPGQKKRTSYLPAFFTKPESASASLQISQRKQSGCQFACMAFITRPITNLPTRKQ